MDKFSLPILVFIIVVLLGANLFLIYDLFFIEGGEKKDLSKENISQKLEEKQKEYQKPELEEEISEIKIIVAGDMMLDRGVEYMVNKFGKGDFKFPFLKIANYLKEADIVFGNLEGPISERGKKLGSIYSFRHNPKIIEGLKYANFNVISLANNHALDYGREALEDTMNILKENEIEYVGAGFNEKEAFSVKIKEVKGQKIGFLSFTNIGTKEFKAGNNFSGISFIEKEDLEKVKEIIKEAKEKVDFLIVAFHSGKEYSFEPTPFQIEFDRMCINAGADVVAGHHPHVVQKTEKYKGGFIVYSLGNFIFDQYFSENTMKGILLEILIKNGKLEKIETKEYKLNEYYQPYFPENKLDFIDLFS